MSLLIAALFAVPLGLWIGHSGRGRVFAVGLVNGARAIPTLGLLFISVLVLAPRISGADAFLIPSILVLVVLAAPPLLAGAYTGIAQVDEVYTFYGSTLFDIETWDDSLRQPPPPPEGGAFDWQYFYLFPTSFYFIFFVPPSGG